MITNGKRNKSEDFTEHKNILEQALAENPCDERRVATTGKFSVLNKGLTFGEIL